MRINQDIGIEYTTVVGENFRFYISRSSGTGEIYLKVEQLILKSLNKDVCISKEDLNDLIEMLTLFKNNLN